MNNPRAFPMPPTSAGGEYYSGQDGMTLRDYFAAKALQSLILIALRPEVDVMLEPDWNQKALVAYRAADAMLEAREK
jgi:hypothetical protein